MTLDELLKERNGYWDNGYAMVRDEQYVRCVATGSPETYSLTDYGVQCLELANTSASKVESSKKRGRKPVQPVDDFTLDDL